MDKSLVSQFASKVLASGNVALDVKASITWSETSDAEYAEAEYLVNEFNAAYFDKYGYTHVPTVSYLIDVTGSQREYFTLWSCHHKVINGKPYSFRKNLAKNLLEAVKSFLKGRVPGETYVEFYDIDLAKWNPQVFRFGKYRGQNIHDVFAKDPFYISWFAQNAGEGSSKVSKGLVAQKALCQALTSEFFSEVRKYNEIMIDSPVYDGKYAENIEVEVTKVSHWASRYNSWSPSTENIEVYGKTTDGYYVYVKSSGQTAESLIDLQKGDSFKIAKATVKKTFNKCGINYTSLYRVKLAA